MHSQQQSPLFGKLPAELRIQIYTEVLIPVDYPLHTPKKSQLRHSTQRSYHQSLLNLKRTQGTQLLTLCKRVQEEAHDIFWDRLTFAVTLGLARTGKPINCVSAFPLELAPRIANMRVYCAPVFPGEAEAVRAHVLQLNEILALAPEVKMVEVCGEHLPKRSPPGFHTDFMGWGWEFHPLTIIRQIEVPTGVEIRVMERSGWWAVHDVKFDDKYVEEAASIMRESGW